MKHTFFSKKFPRFINVIMTRVRIHRNALRPIKTNKSSAFDYFVDMLCPISRPSVCPHSSTLLMCIIIAY